MSGSDKWVGVANKRERRKAGGIKAQEWLNGKQSVYGK